MFDIDDAAQPMRDPQNSPLFEEPTAAIERPDPFSGPQGFMFGGMAQATPGSLAEEYFAAANLLIEAIKRGDCEDYKLGNAALFLYRHSVELMLKAALIQPDRTHDLTRLARKFAQFVEREYGQTLPAWIKNRLIELARVDPGSVAFRYGDYRDPIYGEGPELRGEVYVDLRHLQAAMTSLNSALAPLIGEIALGRELGS